MRYDEIDALNSAYNKYNYEGEIIEIKKRVKEALELLNNFGEYLDSTPQTSQWHYLNPIISKLESIEDYKHEGVNL